MGKVTGVGGVFLGLKGNDQEIRDWYEQYLGMNMSPYGTSFIDGDQLTLVSFTRSNQEGVPYINFRVDSIDEVLSIVQNQGCKITSEVAEYNYGKFAQFQDPFGNYIELWEPYEEEYRKMVQQEIFEYRQKKD
ncbi:VOC family protein [Candidatus Xianfuyuplasma coldseepsis]|uniref:VOC family protein n=1 Tax=Candidatus Xianfuyuplasma coldseepsis TaxID=2782163 RepID=A0A7L7KSV8_9MOLU|nr:VOC family protein [Xianfuyuplasma coldseepsis]QMS85900.1 VOC family protein [Xianfuyuplasma coldseepsis]